MSGDASPRDRLGRLLCASPIQGLAVGGVSMSGRAVWGPGLGKRPVLNRDI